jgi:hypothetical protein
MLLVEIVMHPDQNDEDSLQMPSQTLNQLLHESQVLCVYKNERCHL